MSVLENGFAWVLVNCATTSASNTRSCFLEDVSSGWRNGAHLIITLLYSAMDIALRGFALENSIVRFSMVSKLAI